MANTKKVLEDEFTKAPQAQTEDDVNNQSSRERLWQSLNTTYGNQMEESDKAYDKSISQMNNSMLAKGMQRSSYAAQVAANMYDEKNTARNKLGEALIADYQNRIGDIEAKEKEEAWRNKEWDYKLSRDAVSDKRYEDETAYARSRDTIADKRYEDELAYARGRDTISDQRYADETAYARSRDAVSDKRYEDEIAYSRGRDAVADQRYADETAYSREQDALNRAFTEKQWEAQQAQWREEFEYNKMSDSQKIAYNYIVAAAANGGDVSDSLLQQAGISREDYNAMKAQAQASGYARSYNYNKGGDEAGDETGSESGNSYESLFNELNGGAAAGASKASTDYLKDLLSPANAPSTGDILKSKIMPTSSNDSGVTVRRWDGPIDQALLDRVNDPENVKETGIRVVSTLQEEQKKNKNKSGK